MTYRAKCIGRRAPTIARYLRRALAVRSAAEVSEGLDFRVVVVDDPGFACGWRYDCVDRA